MAIDFADLRRKMVDNQIRTVDVTNLNVLSAFLQVPREEFVPQERRDFAYIDADNSLDISDDSKPARVMMRPASLARLLQLAQITHTDKILNIGATSGYTAALLSRLAAHVVGLECDEALVNRARNILFGLSCENVEMICAPLEEGWVNGAPYDVILCEGAVDFVPPALLAQLRDKGRLVIVEGHGNAGKAQLYIKENDVVSVRYAFNLAVPPLAGFLATADFVF